MPTAISEDGDHQRGLAAVRVADAADDDAAERARQEAEAEDGEGREQRLTSRRRRERSSCAMMVATKP